MLVVISKGICFFLSLLVGSCLSSHILPGHEQAVNEQLGKTGYYLLEGRRATKLRKSLAKKLWPTPIKGSKKSDPPNTQIN